MELAKEEGVTQKQFAKGIRCVKLHKLIYIFMLFSLYDAWLAARYEINMNFKTVRKHSMKHERKTPEDEHPQGIQLPIGMNRSSSWAGHDLVQKDAKSA